MITAQLPLATQQAMAQGSHPANYVRLLTCARDPVFIPGVIADALEYQQSVKMVLETRGCYDEMPEIVQALQWRVDTVLASIWCCGKHCKQN